MQITLGMIVYILEQGFYLKTNLETDTIVPLRSFALLPDNPENDILYLITEKSKVDQFSRATMVIGFQLVLPDTYSGIYISLEERKPVKAVTTQPCCFWNISFDNSLSDLSVLLQQIFSFLYESESRITHMCARRESMDDILNKMESFLGIHSIIFSRDLRIIAVSDGYVMKNPWALNVKTLPTDMLHDLLQDEAFRNASEIHTPTLYYYEDIDQYLYYFNIFSGGSYAARILLSIPSGERFWGGISFAGIIGEMLQESFPYYLQENKLGQKAFRDLLIDLIHGKKRAEAEIEEILSSNYWRDDHYYQVYFLEKMSGESPLATATYYSARLQSLFGNAFIMNENTKFICVRNLTLIPKADRDIRQELAVFLRENLFQCGISREFVDFGSVSQHVSEAEHALYIGRKINSTFWYFNFSDYLLPYICTAATEDISMPLLLHPAVHILSAYDQKENTELLKTAYEYMRHKYNVTQTANALFIHRTTMLFRLSRIETLTGIQWDSFEERLLLGISFELLNLG